MARSLADMEKLQAALATPIVLSLLRAELRAEACRPAVGWDEPSMQKARQQFQMAAVRLRRESAEGRWKRKIKAGWRMSRCSRARSIRL